MPQPSLSPVALTPMVCIECSTVMRPEVIPIGRGSRPKKLDKIVYYCDECKYGSEVTKQHVVCINAPYAEPPIKVPNNREFPPPASQTGQQGVAGQGKPKDPWDKPKDPLRTA